MRRLWISVAVLIALFSFTLWNSQYLSRYTNELTELLRDAEENVMAGNWDAAVQKTNTALDRWTGQELYLHTVLRHNDTDQILLGFREVLQYIEHQEDGGEYSAANARLITNLELLSEMEELNLKNLL